MNAIHQSMYEKLERIYGADRAQAILDDILALIARPQEPPLPEQLAVDQTDVMLITYGDMLYQTGQSPLKTQHRFLKEMIHPIVNSVHLLPFFPYSSDDGFSVIDYYAVDEAIGSWDDVSAMHEDFRLMFDAVFNHISAKSDWFQRFLQDEDPYNQYFIAVPPDTDLSDVIRPRALPLLTPVETTAGTKYVWTTFSDDQIDLNYANPKLLLEILRILLFYVEKGADFLRLDAIAFLWKEIGTTSLHLEQTHLIIQLMRDVLNLVAPETIIITETNVPHEENISYFGDGHNEAQIVYQFPLPPLVLHTLTQGDATALTRWAASLKLPGDKTTFFNFTASHDGIGMRPATGLLSDEEIDALVHVAREHGGEVSYKANKDGSQSVYELNITYFDAITHPDITASQPDLAVARFMVSQAIALALAGVPGIYFHSLFGSRNWKEGVKETGRLRSINREKLSVDALRKALQTEGSIPQRVYKSYKMLLEARRKEAAFHPLAKQQILDFGPQLFAVERTAQDDQIRLLALHNVTGEDVSINLSQYAGAWYDILQNEPVGDLSAVTFAPYQVRWLRSTSA